MKQLFFVSCLLHFFHGYSQTLTYYNYSVAEGLPSAETYDIYQDEKGFMWFGTDNGIVKFDGKEMKIYHLKDSLTDPVVFGFQPDEKGRIWFRTFSGRLSYYENDVIRPYRYNDTLQKIAGNHGLMYFLYQAKEDKLWFSVQNMLGTIDSVGHVKIDKLTDDDSHTTIIYKTLMNNDGLFVNFFRAFPKSILIDNQKFSLKLHESSFFNNIFCKVYWNNKLYISAFNDILEYDGETVRSVYQSDKPLVSLSLDRDGHLWAGFRNGGARRFSSPSFDSFWEPEFLKELSVTKVCQSRDNSFWFSTLENGIFYLANPAISNYILPDNAKVRDVKTSNNYVVVGDKAGGVSFYDRQTQQLAHYKSFPYSIVSLFDDNEDRIWISSHSSVNIFDENFKPIKEHNRSAFDCVEDEDGSFWCVGSLRVFHITAQLEMADIRVTDLYRTILIHDSLILLSQRIGLDIRNKKLELVKAPEDFKNYKISRMITVNDSTILITTLGNGFHMLNTKTWKKTSYDIEHNFMASNIHCALKTDSMLWLGTENGLAVTSVTSLLRGKPQFNFLSRKSGLVSNTINFLAEGANSVWAFSTDGFSVIPNSLNRYADKAPSFYIKTAIVNGKAHSTSELCELESNQNNIKIDFGFISFNNQNIFLRYRINDDNPWTSMNVGDRSIQFSALSSGEYNFQLQYSADNINWANAMPPVEIVIDTPWWTKWYFLTFLALVVVILGYLYFRYQRSIYKQKHHYLKIINEHQQKLLQSEVVTLERERNRIAKELHDRVGTNLTAIKLTVNQVLKHHDNNVSTDVEEQFKIAIEEIKDIIYNLTPPGIERYGLFTGLKNYVGKLNKTIPLNISIKTFGAETHNYDLNILIFRVLQELLSNSIKHSFAENITVHVSTFDDLINIVYEDDGIGFKYDPVQSGLGLNNIETRIQSVNGTLKFESGGYGVSYTIDIPNQTKNYNTQNA